MPRRLFDNFGNYLLLFFVLQVQFAIKGSKAWPGNSQGRTREDAKGGNIDDNQLTVAALETLNNSGTETNTQELLSTHNQEERQEQKEQQVTPSLVVPRAINGMKLEMTDSPDSDRLDYSMLKSSYLNLRPKSISRQSGGYNSGSQTPGLDYDWVDVDSQTSEFSGSSRLARLIYSTDSIAVSGLQDLTPISFDYLCELLEENGDKEMCEDELLLICKRVVAEPETFIKALKDLPLFIQNCSYKSNAIKINSILYSYLGHSGECFKDFKTLENIENGSGSSRCSSRGSGSTIESPPNSPTSEHHTSPEVAAARLKTTGEDFHENSSIRVLEEINEAQARVPHISTPPLFTHNIFGHNMFHTSQLGYLPQNSYSRFVLKHFHSMPVKSALYPLQEESKARTLSSEDESSNLIEEID